MMKIFKKTFLLLLPLFSAATAFASDKLDTAEIKTSAQCGQCKERIESRLKFSKGVKSAKLDLKTKVATIVYDSEKINVQTLKEAITKTGYDAGDMLAEEKPYKRLPKCCQKDAAPH